MGPLKAISENDASEKSPFMPDVKKQPKMSKLDEMRNRLKGKKYLLRYV